MDPASSPSSLLRRARAASGLSLRALAERAGTSSGTLSQYEQGHKEPRLATLRRLLQATGHDVDLTLVPHTPLSREARRSIALHRRMADRLVEDPATTLTKAERNLATMRIANADGSADRWLDEWDRLVQGPLDVLLAALTATDEHAIARRQNTPFAGVLSPVERWTVYREHRPCATPTSTT